MYIQWCELCNAQPSAGILTIVRKGEVEQEFVQACNQCAGEAMTGFEHNDY